MAEFDTSEILAEAQAYWIKAADTPLNDQSAIVRKWSKITKRALEECREALVAVDSYSSPKAGNKEFDGTWRNSSVEVIEGSDYGEIVQTLQYGFATSALPTAQEAQSHDFEHTPFANEDIVDQYDVVYRYRGIDPASYESLKPTLGTVTAGYRTVDVKSQENDDGSIDILELRRKLEIASQDVASGTVTKKIAEHHENWTSSGYTIRWFDVDKDDVSGDVTTLQTPPAGYRVDSIRIDHDRERGTANLTQQLERVYAWSDVDTEAALTYAYAQNGVDAESAEVTWLNVQKADLATALTYAKATSALGTNYVVVSASHNDRGQGSADVTQRLKKKGTGEHISRTTSSGEAAEERVYVLPFRASEPSAPAPAGFTLVYKQENEYDEVLSTWVYHYRKTHTMAAGDAQASAFLFVRDEPGEDVERRRRKYFGVEDAVTTDALFTTATSGYQVRSIDIAERGTGYADVTVTETKVYAAAAAPNYKASVDHYNGDAERRTVRFLAVADPDPADATFQNADAGWKTVRVVADIDGSGIGNVDVQLVKTGSDVGEDRYTVSRRWHLDSDPETFDEVFPDWESRPKDDADWTSDAPSGYALIDEQTTEKGEGIADYRYTWGKVESAIGTPASEGEIIAEARPLDPNGGVTTKIFRNQTWTAGKALVATLKATTNTVRAYTRAKDGQRCDVLWEYRPAAGTVAVYSLKEAFRRQRHTQSPDTDGSDEVTAWKEKLYDEDVEDTITYTFYASIADANTAVTNWITGTPGLAENMRVIALPDGSAYTEFRDRSVTQNSLTTVWKRSV